jgi:hypothetical protein
MGGATGASGAAAGAMTNDRICGNNEAGTETRLPQFVFGVAQERLCC